jgi:hypothetical protein
VKPTLSPVHAAAISIAVALAAFAVPALAQQSATVTEKTVTEETVTHPAQPPAIVTHTMEFQPASTAHDLNKQMLRDFGTVKAADPKIANQLAKNPALVENQAYVDKHPSLQAFLDKYPDARGDIVSSPGNFMTPVAGSKWNSHEAAGIPRDANGN